MNCTIAVREPALMVQSFLAYTTSLYNGFIAVKPLQGNKGGRTSKELNKRNGLRGVSGVKLVSEVSGVKLLSKVSGVKLLSVGCLLVCMGSYGGSSAGKGSKEPNEEHKDFRKKIWFHPNPWRVQMRSSFSQVAPRMQGNPVK